MSETDATRSGTESRTNLRGWKLPRRGRGPWWAAPLAILVLAAMVASTAVVLMGGGAVVTETRSAISLNFGSNPVSHVLNVSFARVAYLSQPTEWNATGFLTSTLVGNGAWLHNSSSYGTHYGIMQFNSSASQVTGSAAYSVAGYLGANVSYAFLDQRVALNGTSATWQASMSESKVATELATTGSVVASSAGAAQNAIWIQSAYASGTYTFTAYDWEEISNSHGSWQNVTAYALPSTAKAAPLSFFEAYIYAQPLQTIVSIVNTTDGAVLGSTAAMHPVLDKNLTSLAYLGDSITGAASGVNSAMVLDSAYLVDHNVYTSQPTVFVTSHGLTPMAVGAVSPGSAPFDPSSVHPSMVNSPSGSSLYSSTTASLGDFQRVTNSTSAASATSNLLNATSFINSTTNATTVHAAQALTTVRSEAEDQSTSSSVSLSVTSWTPQSIATQIHSFLTAYISAQTGIPAADITIPSYLVSDVSVQTQFSSQAATTIHNYLASAIPGFLQSNNLSLVNSQTGAIDAGSDIGMFMDLSTGAIYSPQTNAVGGVYDPVTNAWYASAEMAGFPAGSSAGTAGTIYVPGQAPFLGWVDGEPLFGVGGCFLICSSSLTGAASAVSGYFGSAATTVTNAVGAVTSTASSDVIKSTAGTVGKDVTGFTADLSQSVSDVMPILGGTVANVGGSVSGTLTHTLGGVSGSIGSVASGAAGAILSGVSSFSNTIYHVGAAAGSAISATAGALGNGLNVIGNTAGSVVSTAGAVLSSAYATMGNIGAQVGTTLTGTGRSILSAAGNLAGSVAGALNTVGTTLSKGAGSLWSATQNAFGSLGGAIMGAIEGAASFIGKIISMIFGGASGAGSLLEYIAIAVIGIVIVVAVLFLLMRRRGHPEARQVGGSARGHRRGRHPRAHPRSHAASLASVSDALQFRHQQTGWSA